MSIDTVHSSWLTTALTVWAISIWKWGMTRRLFNVDRSITGRKSPVFFGTRNSLLKKPSQQLLWTSSMAPFSSRFSMAFCRSCFLFLVENWMGVLVKGGWWHYHFNRTPDRRILDDLHSLSRFCHCWPKPASRAPTSMSSFSGTLRRTSHLLRSNSLGPSARVPRCTHCGSCGGEEAADLWLVLLSTSKGLVTALLAYWWSQPLDARVAWTCWSLIVKIFSSNFIGYGPTRACPWNGAVL